MRSLSTNSSKRPFPPCPRSVATATRISRLAARPARGETQGTPSASWGTGGGGVDVVPVEVGDQHGIDVLPRVPALGERLGEPPLGGKPGVHQQDRTSVLDEHEVPGTAASQRPDGESATQGSEAPARIVRPVIS